MIFEFLLAWKRLEGASVSPSQKALLENWATLREKSVFDIVRFLPSVSVLNLKPEKKHTSRMTRHATITFKRENFAMKFEAILN